MERKLYEAAITGDLSLLDDLLCQRIRSLSIAEENPLHTASRFGHVDFIKEVLELNPSLARGLNSQKLSPLHLACSKGHVEIAKALVDSDPDVCFIRDEKGRTPLHIAAEKGQVKVLSALVEAQPRAAWVMTDGGDPILHLCINNIQFEALITLVIMTFPWADTERKLFLNLKDDEGNTVLHLLASKGMSRVIGKLLVIFENELDINAVNNKGLTALDNSMRYSFGGWLETTKILLNAEAGRGRSSLGTLLDMERNIRRNEELVKDYRTWLS